MLSPSGVSPSVTVPREEFAHLEAPFLRTSGSRGLIDDAWQHLDAQLLDAPKDRLEQVLADSFNATYRKPHRRGASVVLSSSGSSSSAASVVSEARPLSLSSPSDGGDAHGIAHPGLAALAGSSIRPDESPFPARPLTPSGASEAADLAWGERCAEFFNGGASSSEMLDVLAKSFSENYARPTKRQRRREPDQQTERQERRQERQERQEKKQEPLPVRTPTTSASQAASQPTVQPTVQTSSQPSERQSASREDHVAAALAPLTDAIAVAMSAPRPSASMAILQKMRATADSSRTGKASISHFVNHVLSFFRSRDPHQRKTTLAPVSFELFCVLFARISDAADVSYIRRKNAYQCEFADPARLASLLGGEWAALVARGRVAGPIRFTLEDNIVTVKIAAER